MMARVLSAVVALLLVAGCGGARAPLDGRAAGYAPGVPDFDLDASVLLSASGAEVEALAAIPRASLVFVRDSSGFRAIARTTFGIEVKTGETPRAPHSRSDTLQVDSFAETIGGAPLLVRQRLSVEPGRAVIQAQVEDARTGVTATRRLAVEVPDAEGGIVLGTPRLDGRASGDSTFRPLVAVGVPASLDSFRVQVDLFGACSAVRIRAEILRVRSDTSVAEPPTAFTPSISSLRARGIDLGTADTVFVSQQRIETPDFSLTVQASLPSLAPGVYRVRLVAFEAGAPEVIGESARTIVVRRPAFPHLVGLADLIPPLAYLATPREMMRLDSADPDSARDAFDRFWGSLFQDRRLASATLEAFYERVEEANRTFSGYSDGWKTDRGMIYTVFGPPESVENRFNSEVWTYGAAPAFVFERTARRERDGTLYDVWTLQRDRAYDASWRRAQRLWRLGQPP